MLCITRIHMCARVSHRPFWLKSTVAFCARPFVAPLLCFLSVGIAVHMWEELLKRGLGVTSAVVGPSRCGAYPGSHYSGLFGPQQRRRFSLHGWLCASRSLGPSVIYGPPLQQRFSLRQPLGAWQSWRHLAAIPLLLVAWDILSCLLSSASLGRSTTIATVGVVACGFGLVDILVSLSGAFAGDGIIWSTPHRTHLLPGLVLARYGFGRFGLTLYCYLVDCRLQLICSQNGLQASALFESCAYCAVFVFAHLDVKAFIRQYVRISSLLASKIWQSLAVR
jgi:hypothetical protein